ncbi:hypothetical protein HL737_001614, partial [Campylobacter lari]|nr:hypothetical protein [Campylobacter lari]
KQGSVKEEFNLDKIKLYQYNLQIQSNRTWFYNKLDEQSEIKITGGRLNSEIAWDIQGDGIIVSKDNKFNSQGEAKATITSKAPFENKIIISASSFGQEVNQKINYVKEKFYSPHIIVGYSNSVYLGVPFGVAIQNLKPNSHVMVSLPDGIKSKKDLNWLYADSYGNLTLKLSVKNPHLKSFQIKIKYEYRESSEELKEMSSDRAIVMIPGIVPDYRSWNISYNPMQHFTEVWTEFSDPEFKKYLPTCSIKSYEIKRGSARIYSVRGGVITFVSDYNTGQYSEATIVFSCFDGELVFSYNISGI